MIEVWEKLDCDSVGRVEIEAIEVVIGEHFGEAAVDSPMMIARMLADEGAVLRHSEIMELYVERHSERPYDAPLRGLYEIESFTQARRKLDDLTNYLNALRTARDKRGETAVRQSVITAREQKLAEAARSESNVSESGEMAEWMRIWLETPEIFGVWVDLRTKSEEFKKAFPTG